MYHAHAITLTRNKSVTRAKVVHKKIIPVQDEKKFLIT